MPSAFLDRVPHLGKKRFHVLLRWSDPEFTVGVFPEVLTQEVEALAYVADVGFLLGEGKSPHPEPVGYGWRSGDEPSPRRLNA